MSPVIELKHLSKRYGSKQALQDVSFLVEKGSIFGFLGENGAGKTTAIKLIVGLLKPNQGMIHLFGKARHQHPKGLMRRVGALIEAPSLYRHLSGQDNLRILARLRGLDQSWIDKALDTVGLTAVAKSRVKTYSHGMCQRLGIAMAILGEPELVILDEPTNGLDPSGIRQMRELILSLPQRFGTTILVSSHLLVEIEHMADRVGILQRGKLLFDGDLPTLRAKAKPAIHIQTNQLEAAEKALTGYVCRLDHSNQRIEIEASQQDIARINQTLVAASIPITEIKAHQPSLEDLYFQLTQAP